MTRIPDLFQTHLNYAGVCVYIDEGCEAADGWFESNQGVDLDCDVSIGNRKHRVSLDIEPPDHDGEVHFHVNIARRNYLPKKLPRTPDSLEEWESIVDSFHGCTGFMAAFGKYSVNEKRVSRKGLVNGLGGISTSIGELEFKLTGAEVSIKGGPYHRITWSKVAEVIRGEIFARRPVVIGREYLSDAVKLLNDGVNRLILEAG